MTPIFLSSGTTIVTAVAKSVVLFVGVVVAVPSFAAGWVCGLCVGCFKTGYESVDNSLNWLQ